MVAADHSSSVLTNKGYAVGGQSCGFIINIKKYDLRIYYTGSTNVFTDMKHIDKMYKPNVVILPIGGRVTMGPDAAAYAIKNFITTPTKIITMEHFQDDG